MNRIRQIIAQRLILIVKFADSIPITQQHNYTTAITQQRQ